MVLLRCKGAFALTDFLDREDGWDWYDAAWAASRAIQSEEAYHRSEEYAHDQQALRQQKRYA